MAEQALGDLGERAHADELDAALAPGARRRAARRRAAIVGIERVDERARKRRRRARRLGRQSLQLGAERVRAPELVAQPPPPALRHVGGGKQRIEQADIADAQPPAGQARLLQRAQHEHERARIGLARVLVAEGLDARLAELARVRCVGARRLKAEGRPVVAVEGLAVGVRVALQVEPAGRHRQVRPQAQLLAAQIGEHVGAPAQCLADHVEEDPRRLDDVGRHGLVAGGDEHRQQRARLRLECLEIYRLRRAHTATMLSVKGRSFGRGGAPRQGR